MVFRALFLAYAPDADMDKHRAVIESSLYKLFVVVVRSQEQALSVAKKLLEDEGIHSILLCPGFTHADVAEIQEAVRGRAGVAVARGDGPSSKITLETMERVGWFKREEVE